MKRISSQANCKISNLATPSSSRFSGFLIKSEHITGHPSEKMMLYLLEHNKQRIFLYSSKQHESFIFKGCISHQQHQLTTPHIPLPAPLKSVVSKCRNAVLAIDKRGVPHSTYIGVPHSYPIGLGHSP